MSDADLIRRLRAELDEANETIRQLRASFAGQEPLPAWAPQGMTPTEQVLLRALLSRDVVTGHAFDAALPLRWQFDGNEKNEYKRLNVFICGLRKHLAPIGVKILTVWGSGGYSLDQASVAEASARYQRFANAERAA